MGDLLKNVQDTIDMYVAAYHRSPPRPWPLPVRTADWVDESERRALNERLSTLCHQAQRRAGRS